MSHLRPLQFPNRSRPINVQAVSIAASGKQYAKNDNFVATMTYADGSICTLTCTALGDKSHPKEMMDIFTDGKVLSLRDYKSLRIAGDKHRAWESITQQKGQLQELGALAECLLNGKEWPILLEDQLEAARVMFEVEQQITTTGSGRLPSREPE